MLSKRIEDIRISVNPEENFEDKEYENSWADSLGKYEGYGKNNRPLSTIMEFHNGCYRKEHLVKNSLIPQMNFNKEKNGKYLQEQEQYPCSVPTENSNHSVSSELYHNQEASHLNMASSMNKENTNMMKVSRNSDLTHGKGSISTHINSNNLPANRSNRCKTKESTKSSTSNHNKKKSKTT